MPTFRESINSFRRQLNSPSRNLRNLYNIKNNLQKRSHGNNVSNEDRYTWNKLKKRYNSLNTRYHITHVLPNYKMNRAAKTIQKAHRARMEKKKARQVLNQWTFYTGLKRAIRRNQMKNIFN